MFEEHISKHSLFRLKIAVGCPRCCGVYVCGVCGVVLVLVFGRGGVVCCVSGVVLVLVFGRGGVVCFVCGVVLVLVFGRGGVVCLCGCCVLCGWCVCFCVVLLFSRFSCSSFLLSLSFFSLLSFFSFLFSLLSSFFSFLFSLLFSPPNTVERTDQPTRRPTSRLLNVISRTAGAQQSVLSLLLFPPSSLPSNPSSKKRRELFITGIFLAMNLFFITVLN